MCDGSAGESTETHRASPGSGYSNVTTSWASVLSGNREQENSFKSYKNEHGKVADMSKTQETSDVNAVSRRRKLKRPRRGSVQLLLTHKQADG